jgi:hypothetical protein
VVGCISYISLFDNVKKDQSASENDADRLHCGWIKVSLLPTKVIGTALRG